MIARAGAGALDLTRLRTFIIVGNADVAHLLKS